MKLTAVLFALIVSTVFAQSKLERACDFRNLVDVPHPVHKDMGFGVWEVPGGKKPALWSLNQYIVGRLEMLEEDGMPYMRITETDAMLDCVLPASDVSNRK